MSIILSRRIKNHIENHVKETLYLDDISKNGNLDEVHMLSRGLVGICLAGLSGKPYAEVAKYITDGSKDNGIDGVYYDAVRNKLFLIQSKWSSKGTGTIDTGDLRKFVAGVYALLNEEWKAFNSRFKAISGEVSAGIRCDPEIVLILCFNSGNPISEECEEILNDFLKENNSGSQEVVTYKVFDIKNLLRTIKAIKSGAKTDVEVNLLQWGEQTTPYYAIYGRVSCADVASWATEHGDLLFSENIRNTLTESEINTQIEATLLKNPSDFWYLNNGITAIADEVKRKAIGLGEQKESAHWKISNLKIVNGAQTTGSIYSAHQKKPSIIANAYVQVKIISLENSPLDIANRITTATNTQNKVEPKDFLALDEKQDGLSESFKKNGIQYCFRRGEKIAEVGRGLDVQELAVSLAVTGPSIGNVVIAKTNAGSLTDPSGAYYQRLFNDNIDTLIAWENVLLLRKASDALTKYVATLDGRDAQIAVHGNRFIEHMVCTAYKSPPSVNSVKDVHIRAKRLIAELYPDCYLAVVFKNIGRCEALKKALYDELPRAARKALSKVSQEGSSVTNIQKGSSSNKPHRTRRK